MSTRALSLAAMEQLCTVCESVVNKILWLNFRQEKLEKLQNNVSLTKHGRVREIRQ